MKKNIKNLLRAVALVGCIFTGTQVAPAQCATIKNDGACDVTVDINIYTGGCSYCNTIPGITIAAGMSYPVDCVGAGCTGVCDIEVTVTGVPSLGTSAPCGFTTGPQPISGAPAGCLHAATVSWNSTSPPSACKIQ